MIIMKMQEGNLEIDGERWVGRERGIKRLKYVQDMYPLPEMNIIIIYSKYILIKNFEKM